MVIFGGFLDVAQQGYVARVVWSISPRADLGSGIDFFFSQHAGSEWRPWEEGGIWLSDVPIHTFL